MSNDNRLVIYSIKYLHSVPLLTIELSSRIKEIVKDSHLIIDVPFLGLKRFAYFPYIIKSHIFDDGITVFFIGSPKRIDKKFAIQYLSNYLKSDRLNCKNYNLKKPIKINYSDFINNNK